MASTAHKIKLVSDRVERAKSFLLSQFRGSPNINALVDVLVTELQELENVLNNLQDVKTVDGSYGTWLNEIGREMKVDRGNYNDEDYKTAIKIAMAKKTSSATAEDILFIVQLLTNDDTVRLENNYPYLMELTGFLFCLADSEEGLASLAELFPVSTRVRLIQQYGKSFKFGTTGRGFASGSTLNNLAYYDYGITNDSRFTTVQDAIIPPPLSTAPFNINPPIISGGDQQGDTLSTTDGDWGGDQPITFSYQWLRDNVDITGATNPTYTIVSDDLGKLVACSVTATNLTGSSSTVSNSILINEVVPPAATYTNNLGMGDIYGTKQVNYVDNKVAFSTLKVNPDGTTERTNSVPESINSSGQVTVADQWLTTVVVGAGSDYTISYIKVSGDNLTGIQPNIEYSLSTERLATLTVSGIAPAIKSGTYTFTIRNINDPTITAQRTITLNSELVDAIN